MPSRIMMFPQIVLNLRWVIIAVDSSGRTPRAAAMLGLAFNDAGVVLSLERTPPLWKRNPRVRLKGVTKILLHRVSEYLIGHQDRKQDTNSNWGGGNVSVQTVAFCSNSCCHLD